MTDIKPESKRTQAAREAMRRMYRPEKILAAFKKHGITAEWTIRQLNEIVRDPRASVEVKLRTLRQLTELRWHAYGSMPAAKPAAMTAADLAFMAEVAAVDS